MEFRIFVSSSLTPDFVMSLAEPQLLNVLLSFDFYVYLLAALSIFLLRLTLLIGRAAI